VRTMHVFGEPVCDDHHRMVDFTKPRKATAKGAVRHSKIGPPMTLWVKRARGNRGRIAAHVRFGSNC
jgi:hypothetical protein